MSLLYSQIQEKLDGRIYGEYFMASCLWHGSDVHPSLMVRETGFHCLSCGKHGSLEFLNRYLGGRDVKTRKNKSQVLPAWRKWEQLYGDLEGIAERAHEMCKKFPGEMWYMKERKIDQFFELGYFGMIENWMLFPVFDVKHKIQNIVVRHTKKKDVRYAIKHVEDSKPILYCPNWERVLKSDVVYCPFGLIDSWAFEEIGLACVTGVSGKSLPSELLSALHKEILLVPDKGEEKEAHQIANKLGWRARVKRITFPDKCKDVDEIRRFYGNEKLIGVLL